MNRYLKNLSKIEFVVTYACTGRCKHCSEGEHELCGERIDPHIAASTVRAVAERYNIKTVLAFGGEPLLYPDAVYEIIAAAKGANIPTRQVITNGYFSVKSDKIHEVATKLSECGVNDLLLSTDAFHQETIPLDIVRIFAKKAIECGIPIRLQPAWLVSRENNNPYNRKTREILSNLQDLKIPVSEGNVIFPEGNAKRYLAEYFESSSPKNPYFEDAWDVRCLSFSPSGDVLCGNVYECDIIDIIEKYEP